MSEPISIKSFTHFELKRALRTGKFANFRGTIESAQIDFKEAPYVMNVSGKKDNQFELAKDVASIANSEQGGGVICIGVKEGRKDNSSYADSLTSVDKNLVNEESWRQVLKNNVHPPIPDELIELVWYTIDGEDIVCIHIKETPLKQFPYMAVKRIDGQIEYFIVPYRAGDKTAVDVALKYQQIHQYIQRGLEERNHPQRVKGIQRVESKIDSIKLQLSNITKHLSRLPESPIESFKKHDRSFLNAIKAYATKSMNISEGIFFMHAIPKQSTSIANFSDGEGNGLYELLKTPPKLRDSGWDLGIAFSEIPTFVDDRWEARNGDAKLISINQNAEVFAAGVLHGFLDWGLQDYQVQTRASGKLVNNFALVEFIDRFVEFIKVLDVKYSLSHEFDITLGFVLKAGMEVNLFRPPHLGWYINSVSSSLKESRQVVIPLKFEKHKATRYYAGSVVRELYARFFSETPPNFSLPYLGKDDVGWFVEEERYTKR